MRLEELHNTDHTHSLRYIMSKIKQFFIDLEEKFGDLAEKIF